MNVTPRSRICMDLIYLDPQLRVLNYFGSNNSNHHQYTLCKVCIFIHWRWGARGLVWFIKDTCCWHHNLFWTSRKIGVFVVYLLSLWQGSLWAEKSWLMIGVWLSVKESWCGALLDNSLGTSLGGYLFTRLPNFVENRQHWYSHYAQHHQREVVLPLTQGRRVDWGHRQREEKRV